MNIEIYADVVFFINFIMDFFIFWVVSKFVKRKTTLSRLCMGAFTGAFLYCVIIFIPKLFNISGFISTLVISIIVCFRPKSLKEFGRLTLLTIISVFCIGGAIVALFYFISIHDILKNIQGTPINSFSIKLLLFSSFTTFVLIKLLIARYHKYIMKRQTFYDVTIKINDTTVSLNALVDTGNSLHDPLSDDPVIIVEFESIRKFLPDQINLIFYEKKENDLAFVTERINNCNMSTKLRMIPYSSLGKQNGMLIGLRADNVTVTNNADSFSFQQAIIAIYNFKLSKDSFYQALLNPDILY